MDGDILKLIFTIHPKSTVLPITQLKSSTNFANIMPLLPETLFHVQQLHILQTSELVTILVIM